MMDVIQILAHFDDYYDLKNAFVKLRHGLRGLYKLEYY